MATKTTKRQTTPTLQERLSEIDWDLLELLDQQDEGQYLPMRDNPQPRVTESYASPEDWIKEQMRQEGSLGNFPKGSPSK